MKMHWFAMQVEPLLSKNKGSLKNLTLAQKGAFTMLLALAAKLNESGKFVWNGDPLSEKEIVTFTGIESKRDKITMYVTIHLLLDLEILEKVQSNRLNVPEIEPSTVLNVPKKIHSTMQLVPKKDVQVVYAFQKWDVYQNYWESRKNDFTTKKAVSEQNSKNTQYINTNIKKENETTPTAWDADKTSTDNISAFKNWYSEAYKQLLGSNYVPGEWDNKRITHLLKNMPFKELIDKVSLLLHSKHSVYGQNVETIQKGLNLLNNVENKNDFDPSRSGAKPGKATPKGSAKVAHLI